MTTIAPSTSIPTAIINANRTIILIEIPAIEIINMPKRKLPGIAIPTKIAERKPRIPMIMMKTNTTAEMTLF